MNLSKIGDIKIKIHRKVEVCIKSVLIKRLGKRWFVVVPAEQETESLPQTVNVAGPDVGLKFFVVDSDENSVENPRFAEKSAIKIKSI